MRGGMRRHRNIQAEAQTQRHSTRRNREKGTDREGRREREGGRQTERDKRETESSRCGEARGAARPGHSLGDAGARRPCSRRCPAPAARPDPPWTRGLSLRHASPSRSLRPWTLLPRNGNAGRVRGRARGAAVSPGHPVPRPRPQPRRPDRPGTKLAAGGAALPLRPPPPASGRPRAGQDGTYRARRRRGAGCGPRGWQARRPREARRGWAARRAVCGPGRARGAGERRASGSDVRGVSAPNRERGRGQRREGREQERAGGALGRSLRGPGPFSPPPGSLRPALGAGRWRGGAAGAALAGAPGTGRRAPRPGTFWISRRRVSRRLAASPPDFPRGGASAHARPRGDKHGGFLYVGTTVLLRRCGAPVHQSRHQGTVLAPKSCGRPAC